MTEDWLKQNIWPRFSRVLNRYEIYLANHSLGRPPDKSSDDVQAALAAWYEKMDDAWDDWMDEMDWFRSSVAELTNAKGVVPKTSAGQGLRAVINALKTPTNITTTNKEFESIDFILKVYESKGRAKVRWSSPQDLLDAITDETDLVVFSLVLFGTGEILQNANEIIARAHAVGAKTIVDVYHAVGVIPVDMAELKADFMIGGSYKYTRGGPGACWLAYGDTDLRTLDTGWFAKENPLSFEPHGEIKWGDAWLESTPAILPIYQARAGLEIIKELGVDNLRKYSLEQQEFLREAFLAEGVACVIPDDPKTRGAFSLLKVANAGILATSLKANGVNVDARGEHVRFCPDFLNTEDEIREAAKIAASLIQQRGETIPSS
ncbi:MAG: aminotransferase class V-fold PLP-dependent enzyme [Armatimonadota bacterium]|nr:aminotransferase class V-fold PLP-dependent enzyme [Armatimonadota bacterium]